MLKFRALINLPIFGANLIVDLVSEDGMKPDRILSCLVGCPANRAHMNRPKVKDVRWPSLQTISRLTLITAPAVVVANRGEVLIAQSNIPNTISLQNVLGFQFQELYKSP